MMNRDDIFGYQPTENYKKPVAYFSMEFAIDQALKIYSGGLGFLAGSHLKSAYELKQNIIGVGMLWKYGYYDQGRDGNNLMTPAFIEKNYSFLKDTGVQFTLMVHSTKVHVKAYLLHPEVFKTAPLFLLSTDVPENDWLARSISHRLYDPHEATRIAQSIVLGAGGAKLLDVLNLTPDVYHMNEGHGIPLCFYLYSKFKNLAEVKKHVVFTTHTPEMAGNEAHSYGMLNDMSLFHHLSDGEVRGLLNLDGDNFNYTLAALKFAGKANAVSKLHGEVAKGMWNNNSGICEIISITNAQNKTYWKDTVLDDAIAQNNNDAVMQRKRELKRELFKTVADQCGKLFDENVLTIVWARRFAGYKRADMLMYNWQRFITLMTNAKFPVQVIWAGKPYPEDQGAINDFNKIINTLKGFANGAVLTGYELGLSKLLKQGSDVWLNTPRKYREASGTSGMTAAMNGSINLSIPDGWIPEFARDQENCFIIETAPDDFSGQEKDRLENINLMDKLENIVLPMYYTNQQAWVDMVKTAAADVSIAFNSGRMADEYYEKMYKI